MAPFSNENCEIRRKRRKKSRTQNISDCESSNNESDQMDVEVDDIDKPDEILDIGNADFGISLKEFPEPREPVTGDLGSDRAQAQFLNRLTSEFGTDIDALCRSNDYKDDSLLVIVRALKKGVDVFSPEQQACWCTRPDQ